MPDLTHDEMQELDAESLSNYLAYGPCLDQFDDSEEVQAYFDSYREFDL